MKTRLIGLLCILIYSLSFSQRKAGKILTFESKVKDLIIVPFNGLTVISDKDKIYGYDGTKDQIIWETPIPKRQALQLGTELLNNGISPSSILGLSKNLNGPDFTSIPNTPFLQKIVDNRLFVINSFDGKFIFETTDPKTFFYQTEYLIDEDVLLLRGVEGKKLVLAKYDLRNKNFKWHTILNEDFVSKFSFLTANKGNSLKDKMEYTAEKIFLLAKSKFYALDRSNGNVLWKIDDEKENFNNFYYNVKGTDVVLSKSKGLLGSKDILYLKNAENGTDKWKKPIETKYLVLFEDWGDKMLLGHYKGFNFYDYDSGQKLWEKDPKGKGIKSVITIDKDFLYVYDDEMMLLNKEGQKKWKKDVKICDDEEDPIFFLEKTNNGKVLYVTATYANLVEYDTGKKLWKGNLKLNEKRPTFAEFDENSGNFVIFNDEELYKFNENTAEKPKPYSKLKLKDEKLITSLEVFPNNVTITGQSEIVGVKNDGSILFQNEYKQPGELGRKFIKAGAGFAKFAASVATAKIEVYQVNRDANGNIISKEKIGELQFNKNIQAMGHAGYFAASEVGALVKKRFNALQETEKFAILFAKGINGEKLLIKVDKQTGKEIDKIIVENNKPVYDYDPVSDNLFYSKDNQVKIFIGK